MELVNIIPVASKTDPRNMTQQGYAGYFLKEQMLSRRENVEHWIAEGAAGEAEVYFLPSQLRNVLLGLPNWNAFAEFHMIEEKHRLAVVVPGKLVRTIEAIAEEESSGISCCLAWHLAAIFGELHETGGVHGFIHPAHIGLDLSGQLQIRPALSAFIPSDPDDEAAALATDCWQLSFVLQKMGVLPSLDRRFGLLMSGLRQEVSRLRLQPASAIRQTLTAVIARHPEWEDEIGQRLGKQWMLDYSPVKEENVVPHRLSQRTGSLNRPQKSRVEVDVWASPFIRTVMENNDHSSGQAMIREALRKTSNPKKFELPVMEDFQLEDEVTELEPARIQLPQNEVQLFPAQNNQTSSESRGTSRRETGKILVP